MVELQSKVVALSAEVADKDYEIEFYGNSIEELQNEVNTLKGQPMKRTGGAEQGQTTDTTEVDNWKKKCKTLQL